MSVASTPDRPLIWSVRVTPTFANTYLVEGYGLIGLRAGLSRAGWEFSELRNLFDKEYIAPTHVSCIRERRWPHLLDDDCRTDFRRHVCGAARRGTHPVAPPRLLMAFGGLPSVALSLDNVRK
jgi:hypothetical protein